MIYLLDAAAVINNLDFSFDESNEYYTTSYVEREWRDQRSRLLVDNACKLGLLVIRDPSKVSLDKVNFTLEERNMALSEADVSIVALALDFKDSGESFLVLTDDYSVQNLLKGFKIRFEGVFQAGIRREVKKFKKNN